MIEWGAVRNSTSSPKHAAVVGWKHLWNRRVSNRCLKIGAQSKGYIDGLLECSLALVMVAAEARLRVAEQQAARTFPWIGAHDPADAQRLQDEQHSIRSHFGSRAISCSNVHGVFSRSRALLGFALSKSLQPSFVVSHLFSWHVRVMERTCQFLRYLPPLRIWVLLTALFLTSKEQDTVPVRWRRKSTKCSYKLRSCRYSCRAYPDSKIASKRFPTQLKIRISNKWLAALQPVLPHSAGPMALGHPMTIEIQDADLIPPQALLMNTREVPSYYDSLANNTTKGLPSGSIVQHASRQ